MNIVPSFRESLSSRPAQQRILEFKYRFAQSVVFGLPVMGLQLFGRSLGGSPAEAQRWVALLQALLSGWIVYVAATGLLIEGLLFPRKFTADLSIAIVATLLFLASFLATLAITFRGVAPAFSPRFHWVVLLLALWCGLRWWMLWRRALQISASDYKSV